MLLAHEEYPFPSPVRRAILAAMNAELARVADLARLNFLLGELYAEAVAKACLLYTSRERPTAATASKSRSWRDCRTKSWCERARCWPSMNRPSTGSRVI